MSAKSTDGLPQNRRIVVVRSPNNPNVHQGPVDLKEYERGNALDLPAVASDGRKSVYLLRRTILPSKSDTHEERVESRSPTPPPPPPLEDIEPPSPHPSSPPFRPKSSKPVIQTQPTTNKTERLKQMTQTRFRDSTRRKTVPTSSSSPTLIINTELEQQSQSMSRIKSAHRKKSAKSMVFVNPEDQSIAVVESSFVKGESIRPVIMKRPKSMKKTRLGNQKKDDSREELVGKNRSQGCLGCLSRCICLIIIICIFLVIIGLAGIGVSAYFLAIDSVNNLIPTIVGISVGGVLIIGGFTFLCIVLACLGTRDGYFTYTKNDNASVPSTGRAYALVPPSHRNAQLYVPRDYSEMTETNHSTSLVTPISTAPSNRSTVQHHESRPVKPNITIEVPERLLTGRKLSPRSRERSLNKVVKNLGHIVEDAKKHCNGDMPSKVIVKVDDHADGK